MPGSGSISKRRGSLPLLSEISLPPAEPASSADPSPAKSSSSSSKKWSFFGLDHFPGSASPSKSRPASLDLKDSISTTAFAHDLTLSDLQYPTEKGSKKHSKRKRKVKTWAGSILTKRPKGRYGKGKKAVRRGPTPPPVRHGDEDDEDNASDSAETKSEPGMPTVMITELDEQGHGGMEAWKPPRPVTEADTAYPVIDLDAALGPFNTPLPRNAEWEAAQKAGGVLKRQLHSAAGMSRFSGPGMHYTHHQRAQSSPEMPPFEFRRGINRFGSSSTMADVFEEEEEDDDSDNAKSSSSTGSSTPQAGSAPLQGDDTLDLTGFFSGQAFEKTVDKNATPVAKRHGSDPEEIRLQRSGSMRSRTSMSSLHEQIIEEEPDVTSPSFRTVEFGRPAQQRLITVPDSPLLSPVSLGAPESSSSQNTISSLAPISPYSATGSSSFPSPRSLLYDGTILSTAPSSVTDDSYHSLLMGEPGPEVRRSFDVPSLSSSHSTQTRESSFAQQAAQLNRVPEPGERPASFSVMAFGGGRRGSLASLGRLISSSHGERSKLSLEVYNSDSDKKSKDGKARDSKPKRRLSRMVRFWKTKEAPKSS
ncbi:unnamed protein product [Discula destructiva]